jgi:hypothetical protein
MRSTVLAICLIVLTGCSRSGDGESSKSKVEAEAAKAELAKANAELVRLKSSQSELPVASAPKVDVDRRAAEWVLRVDGSVRVVVDGVPHEIKKGEKLPGGSVKLLAVNLGGCPKATDDGREYLRGLKGLQELHINDGTGIRNLDFLADMTGLQALFSEGATPLFSDMDFVHIKEMKQIKTLVVVNQWGNHPNEKLTGKAFNAIKELKQLENLRLCNCNLRGDGIRQIEGHPTLRTLDFWQSKIEDSQLASLATLPKLESLHVTGTPITDKGLPHLRGCRHLSRLNLDWTAITDAGLESLSSLELKEVGIKETKVTEAGAKKLEKAIPGLRVNR